MRGKIVNKNIENSIENSSENSSVSDKPPASEKPPSTEPEKSSHRAKHNTSNGKNGTNKSSSKPGKTQRKVLGPVGNLEEYVRPDWWRLIFNSLYLKTDGDVVDDQNITRHEIAFFSEILQIQPDAKVLDLCCGQGRHSLELARRGLKNVEGLDRSHYLIQKGKATAKKENLSVKFREGDARKLPYPPDTFDAVVILGNSFGYFETKHDDLKVLEEISRILKPDGKILIDVTDGEYLRKNFQPRSWEWIGKKQFVCRERSLSKDEDRLISREVITDVEKGVLADQFYAERLYTRASISELIKEAGFSDLAFHGNLNPDSQRNQDLGMMAQRIIFTAAIHKDWTVRKKKPKDAVREVVVLMGDPSLKDPVKPSSVFDQDDFDTIKHLKSALHEIDDYHFTYFSHHSGLFQDFKKIAEKAAFVFNLCDEGYMNDPHKELHIPALLDISGISYTGAGPKCLAYCYDKSLVRGIAKEMNIPVPNGFFIMPQDNVFGLPLHFPVIVKPNFGDASFGITQKSVANNLEELVLAISAVREKLGYDKPILVEEFLTGKDLSVGIIGNPPTYTALPIIEDNYADLPENLPKISAYEAKWLPESPYWSGIKYIAADLPDETEKAIIEYSLRMFERMGCQDYARVDWRLDAAGHPKMLEVNPNPGWCWDSHLSKMAKLNGNSYSDMLKMILQAAEKRLRLFDETGVEKKTSSPLPSKEL